MNNLSVMLHIISGRNLLILLLFFIITDANAQFSQGMSGGLNAPTAQMMTDGTFSFGGNYLPQQMMPSSWNYNTGNYFLNITFFSFMEISYRSTFLKCEKKTPLQTKYYWNKDRSVGLKLRLLPEYKTWRPALAIGSNDVVTTSNVTQITNDKQNRYFASIYGVLSKTLQIGKQDFFISAGYYIPFYTRSKKEGLFGSIAWQPNFLKELSVWSEYDCEAINIGLRTRLFNHLELQVYYYDFKSISAGIRYNVNLLGRRAKCDN
ncbi:MAG: YjbH domain-containing protein [Bacteroidales bacterium]